MLLFRSSRYCTICFSGSLVCCCCPVVNVVGVVIVLLLSCRILCRHLLIIPSIVHLTSSRYEVCLWNTGQSVEVVFPDEMLNRGHAIMANELNYRNRPANEAAAAAAAAADDALHLAPNNHDGDQRRCASTSTSISGGGVQSPPVPNWNVVEHNLPLPAVAGSVTRPVKEFGTEKRELGVRFYVMLCTGKVARCPAAIKML